MSGLEDKIYGYGGIVTGLVGLYQANSLHQQEKERSRKRHEAAMELAKQQHAKDLQLAKQTYLLQIFNSLEQHFQQLNADLIASSKESERDMFDQRNQSFQTIILSSSVMFSALTTVIVQGFLPGRSGDFLFIAYALTSSLSFAFLFLCIVICIEVIMRASSFMYDRANKHTKQLGEAIKKTKEMMRNLRRDAEMTAAATPSAGNGPMRTNNDNSNNSSGSSSSTAKGPPPPPPPPYPTSLKLTRGETNESSSMNYRKRPGISSMDTSALEREWRNHESEVQKYLLERGQINDRTVPKKSFQQFWEESCHFWAYIAILFFYAGSLNLLLAIMIYMWAEFLLNYSSLVGAIIAVTLVGLSVVMGMVIVVVLRSADKHRPSTNVESLSDDSSSVISDVGGDAASNKTPPPEVGRAAGAAGGSGSIGVSRTNLSKVGVVTV